MTVLNLQATFPSGQTLSASVCLPITEQALRSAFESLDDTLQWVKQTQPQMLHAPGVQDDLIQVDAETGSDTFGVEFLLGDAHAALSLLATQMLRHPEIERRAA